MEEGPGINLSKEPKLEKLKYRCTKCGVITEHIRMRRPQAWCPKCKKSRMQRLVLDVVGRPLASPSRPVAVRGEVTVTHVPEIVTPEAPKVGVEPGVPEESEWARAPAGEPLVLSEEDWADLYGMPAEAISIALKAPELNFSDESCKVQGVRLSRFCQRHNIMLPPWLDLVPIVSRAAGDYMKLFRDASLLMKERQKEEPSKPKPKEVKIPESTVEHVAPSSEVPADFDIDRALKRAYERKAPAVPSTGGP